MCKIQKQRPATDESKRRDLKRIATFFGVALLASSLVFVAGCETTKGKKENKTLDEFLAAEKPSY